MNGWHLAGRDILWNTTAPGFLYIAFFIACVVFYLGITRKIAFVRRGKQDPTRLSSPARRFRYACKAVLAQTKTLKRIVPGAAHTLIFYPFVILVITTLAVAVDHDLGIPIFHGYVYSILSFLADISGVLILSGTVSLIIHRYRQSTHGHNHLPGMAVNVLFILVVVTGFLVEALRLRLAPEPVMWISPVGQAMAASIPSSLTGPGPENLLHVHAVMWWIHALLSFTWIALLPYTKFLHGITIAVNAFFKKQDLYGVVPRRDIDTLLADPHFDVTELSVGIGHTRDLTFKHRLDTLACISCGRCEQVCPPYLAGEDFSPKTFIERIGELMRDAEYYWQYAAKDKSACFAAISGNVFDDDYPWHCRTCLACVTICPAFIEHMDLFIELRRYGVNIKGIIPNQAGHARKMLENMGNPFGPPSEKKSWLSSLTSRVLKKGESCHTLFFIGCHIAHTPSSRPIAENVLALLRQVKEDTAILGPLENCCGDPYRILGDEHGYQAAVKKQIQLLKEYSFKRIVTACPHCANMIRNEYSLFGGCFDVYHYTEFLLPRLLPMLSPAPGTAPARVTFHDPCFLGRYHHAYSAPRKIIETLPGTRLVEMDMHHETSLCCGGGGGHYFMDFHQQTPVNHLRIRQAKAVHAEIMITACPYCRSMLEDARKSLQSRFPVQITDLSELLFNALNKRKTRPN